MRNVDASWRSTAFWLPLAVAVLPVLATHAAYVLSIRDGFVPACLPYWDGCTSISRAARHGEGNLLFKAVMLPSAALLGWLWWRAGEWTGVRDAPLRALGLIAACALGVYVAFLGAEGDFSRWLRRYGALIYFGANYLAMILWVRGAHRAGLRSGAMRLQTLLCVLLLAFGLISVAASALVDDAGLKDRIENAIEWTLGALFTLWFLALAFHARSPAPGRS